MACISTTPVSTDLSLALCPTIPCASSSKRKSCDEAAIAASARKRLRSDLNSEHRSWFCSTALKLYDDPWKIKKVLRESDLGNLSRLLLPKDLAQDLVLPVLGADADVDNGTQIGIWDVDTNSMHSLLFKHWISSKSYVVIGNWHHEFVKRRDLKKGDEIGLHWDSYKNRFNFTVLRTYKPH